MSVRTAGILLAAGRSSRMGRAKALLSFGGRSVIDALIEEYAAAELDPLIVVASGPTAAVVRRYPEVKLIEGDPSQPMIDSLARAIEALPEDVAAAVVQPVDAPFTAREMIAALLVGGVSRSRVLCHQGAPGHPVLVARTLFAQVLERPAHGLREVLAANEIELVEWPDRRVLADLDTPQDLIAWGGDGSLH